MDQVLTGAIIDKIIPAFGWMLIHSLWEGLLFAIITGVALMLTKKSSAAYRYNLALLLFIGFTSACALTFILEWNSGAAPGALKPLLPGNGGTIAPALFFSNIHGLKQLVKTLTDYFSANEPLLVLIWFIVFLFKSVKMMACLVYNQQIRTRQVSEPSEFWVKTVAAFAEKLQIRKAVKLLQSGYIKMPVVVGHLKPIILIPAGILASLPAEQVEAILLHELAHIRRNDYFVNFLQNIAETVFFFNPGLLWISSILREERENCCDDIALAQTQNKVGFVQALISFKEHEMYGSSYAVAFPGKRNYLLRRVSRIMSNKNMNFGPGERIFFICSILILSALMTAASVAQIKEYAKTGFGKTHAVHAPMAVISEKSVVVTNSGAIRAIRAKLKHAQVKARLEMQSGIAGITGKTGSVETIRVIVQPKEAAVPVNNQPKLSDQEEAEKDQIQARKDQAQAKIDEVQALKDRADALRDQAQALKDQAQAKLDQAQAKAEQDEPKGNVQVRTDKKQELVIADEEQARLNQEQAVRNKEQARLNQIQEQKNREQVVRNEEQAKKNQQQALKNQQQAQRNLEQDQKNREQAEKNKVSVQ